MNAHENQNNANAPNADAPKVSPFFHSSRLANNWAKPPRNIAVEITITASANIPMIINPRNVAANPRPKKPNGAGLAVVSLITTSPSIV